MKKKIIKHADWHMEETDYIELKVEQKASSIPLLLTPRELLRAQGRWLLEHESEITVKLREKED